ncbi:hypothetical protein Bbelb_375240 [Branchiostoma belcheri]|nr:hypothetical protein Bbelb_375240 [Branchiostoma belcheri]
MGYCGLQQNRKWAISPLLRRKNATCFREGYRCLRKGFPERVKHEKPCPSGGSDNCEAPVPMARQGSVRFTKTPVRLIMAELNRVFWTANYYVSILAANFSFRSSCHPAEKLAGKRSNVPIIHLTPPAQITSPICNLYTVGRISRISSENRDEMAGRVSPLGTRSLPRPRLPHPPMTSQGPGIIQARKKCLSDKPVSRAQRQWNTRNLLRSAMCERPQRFWFLSPVRNFSHEIRADTGRRLGLAPSPKGCQPATSLTHYVTRDERPALTAV